MALVIGSFALLALLSRDRKFTPAASMLRRVILICLLAFAPLTQVVFLPYHWRNAGELIGRDAGVSWLAAERVRSGQPLYNPVPEGPQTFGDPGLYIYPPFLGPAVALLPPLSMLSFGRIMMVLALLGLWAFAAELAALSGRLTPTRTLAWGMVLTIWPHATFTAMIGNPEPILWTLVGLAIIWPGFRGIGFTLAALIKPYSIWPLVVSWWRDGRRVATTAAYTAMASSLIAVAALGPVGFVDACVAWLRDVYPNISQGQTSIRPPNFFGVLTHGDISIPFAPINIAVWQFGWHAEGGNLPGFARTYLSIASIVGPVVAAWLTRHRSVRMQCAATLSAALAFAPIFRAPHAALAVLLPLAVWMGERKTHRQRVAEQAGSYGDNPR
jgi:hypothetical protein